MSRLVASIGGWLQEVGRPGTALGQGARTFRLRPWFALVSLASIGALTVASTVLFSKLMTDRMLRQEGVLTMEYVQSTFLVERPAFLYGGEPSEKDRTAAGILVHLASLPDVLRANIYRADRQLYWSSDPTLTGQRFSDNPELERALAGELVVNEEDESPGHLPAKREHVNLPSVQEGQADYFVEIYVPIWDEAHSRVLGAVELYKRPQALFEALQSGKRLLWGGAIGGALFLYLMLYWIIRRADALLLDQQARLVESERLAAIGELGSAVAHGIRNPLAAMRSSAELALEGDSELSREAARDIMAEADRLEQWIKELLSYSRPMAARTETVDLAEVLSRALDGYGRELERRDIRRDVRLPAQLPRVVGDTMLYGQVFNSLLANAVEAIDQRGAIAVSGSVTDDGRRVLMRLQDDGPGMTAEQREMAFRPFFTTKTKGLGVGLPLARRIIERFGGTITIGSEPGRGTTVFIEFAVAG